jgi:pimeloyl-ACP methyl ester carboxylesterase
LHVRSYDLDKSTIVVLLHAFPMSGKMFTKTITRLRKAGFGVFVPDLPGFGESEGTIDSMSAAAEGIIEPAEAAGIKSAVFCGISMGGYVLLEILQQRPRIVQKAVLCDTTCKADTSEKRQMRLASIERIENGELAVVLDKFPLQLVSSHTIESKPETYQMIKSLCAEARGDAACAAQLAMSSRKDFSEFLSGIECPVLLVYGDDDPSLADGRMMNEMLKGSAIRIIPQTGHYSCLESEGEFNDILLGYIDQKS